jgi:RHS repeat-associated protein
VSKTVGSTTTWYIYGLGGELVAEYPANGAVGAPQKEYGYRGGQMLVVYDSTETGNKQFQWLVQDHLGSTRMVVDLSGSLTGMKRHDYLPFGEEILANTGGRTAAQGYPPPDDKVRQKFTGYERDVETGLDYAQARMFGSAQGRFTSVDPLHITKERIADPQRINLYAYTRNNPLAYIDPIGEDVYAVFNKDTGQLTIENLDNHKDGLPYKWVSAKDYKPDGIRDKKGNLTHNQVLVIDDVFSGGIATENGKSRDVSPDSKELPIPNGDYDLLQYEGNKPTKWYKVDPQDSSRYDDEHQGVKNNDGENRTGYRLHLGVTSHGCVTVCDVNKTRQGEWAVVEQVFASTSTTQVPKREGFQAYNPFSGTRTRYGTITIRGTDNIRERGRRGN